MRILVVEDETDLAAALERGLRSAGYAVDVASTGDRALAQAAGDRYDLVLLDRRLPDADGGAVCRELRRRGAKVPIVFLTARDAVADRVEGLDAGADDYLVKPFALEELLARVRAQVRRQTPGRSSVLAVADLRLDLTRGEVTRAGVPLTLSRKEFMLLAHLMRQPGRLYSKEELLEAVWDDPTEPTSDVVRAQVKNLRKKVDDLFEPKLIRTVLGMGYKIGP